MENKKYKLRCRNKGVVVTKRCLSNYDIIWKREFNPNIYPEDDICFKAGEFVLDRWRRKLEIVEILKPPFFKYLLKDDCGYTSTNFVLKIK